MEVDRAQRKHDKSPPRKHDRMKAREDARQAASRSGQDRQPPERSPSGT